MQKEIRIKRIKDMYDRNLPLKFIAQTLKISANTVSKILKETYPERDTIRSVRFNDRLRKNYERRKEDENRRKNN